jgi:hypothetical protein
MNRFVYQEIWAEPMQHGCETVQHIGRGSGQGVSELQHNGGGQAPSISQTRETYQPAHHLTHLAKPADAAPMVAPFRPAINAPTNMPRPAALAMFSVSCFQFRCGLIQGRTWDAFI